MATTDRTAVARPGLGNRESGRARPGGRRAEWWRGWFAPAQGLRPRPLDVLVALVIAFVQVAGTITYSQHEPPSPWAFDAFACISLVAGPVALLFRRRWPEATLAVTFAATAGYAAHRPQASRVTAGCGATSRAAAAILAPRARAVVAGKSRPSPSRHHYGPRAATTFPHEAAACRQKVEALRAKYGR